MVTLFDVAVALPWALVALGCWLGYVLVRQGGRIVERLEDVERELDSVQDQLEELYPEPTPGGLPAGSEAPAFELPALDGRRVSLGEFQGRRVLLIFFSPTCPFCQQMAPDLARLAPDGGDGRPIPVIVAAGEPAANRAMAEEHGIRCPVLLDEKNEVAGLYEPEGTPAAYLVDEFGLIAKPRGDGMPGVLALAQPVKDTAERPQEEPAGVPAPAQTPAGATAAGVASDGGAAAGLRHELRVPLSAIPAEGIGMGDLIKRMTDKFGIKPCRGCERRRVALNRWVIKGSGGGRSREPR